MNAAIKWTCYCLLALGTNSMPALAADGELDPAFGTRVLPVGVATPQSAGSAMQSDGRIVLTAWGSTADSSCAARTSTAVVRLLPNGSFDPGFGDSATPGATRLLGFCNEQLVLVAVAVQADGKLVLAGTRYYADGRSEAVVIRLLPSGAIDSGFGVQGLATLARASSLVPGDAAAAVAILPGPAQRIVVAGTAIDRATSNEPQLLLFVLDASGVVLPWGNYPDLGGLRYWREAVVRAGWTCAVRPAFRGLQVGGGIAFVATTANCRAGGQFSETPFLFRIDTGLNVAAQRRSFHVDPAITLDAEGFAPVNFGVLGVGLERDPRNGRLWVAGLTQGMSGAFVQGLAALRADLAPDTSVLAGSARAVFPQAADFVGAALHLQGDGKLVIAGALNISPVRMATLRVSADSGAIDAAFGGAGNGIGGVSFGAQGAIAFSVLGVPPDGRLLLVGNTRQVDGTPVNLVVARLLNSVDAGFGDGFE